MCTAVFKNFFNEEFMKFGIERCSSEVFESFLKDCIVEKDFCNAAPALRVLVFSKIQGENKVLYQDWIGKLFSQFRRGFILTVLLGMKQNNFGIYKVRQHDELLDVPRIKFNSVPRPILARPRLRYWGSHICYMQEDCGSWVSHDLFCGSQLACRWAKRMERQEREWLHVYIWKCRLCIR